MRIISILPISQFIPIKIIGFNSDYRAHIISQISAYTDICSGLTINNIFENTLYDNRIITLGTLHHIPLSTFSINDPIYPSLSPPYLSNEGYQRIGRVRSLTKLLIEIAILPSYILPHITHHSFTGSGTLDPIILPHPFIPTSTRLLIDGLEWNPDWYIEEKDSNNDYKIINPNYPIPSGSNCWIRYQRK